MSEREETRQDVVVKHQEIYNIDENLDLALFEGRTTITPHNLEDFTKFGNCETYWRIQGSRRTDQILHNFIGIFNN